MVVRLETIENIAGVEIGFPADATSDEVVEALAGAAGELTVIARLSLSCAVDLASGVIRAGVSALSLAPPRGALPGHGGELISGRLYGPGVFPQVLLVTSELARQGIPLIAAGGVYRREDADALLDAGALAVQVDAVLWRGDWLERGD
jgi:dihydroorotate dehydrogenase (NAD+) catalytic subunit